MFEGLCGTIQPGSAGLSVCLWRVFRGHESIPFLNPTNARTTHTSLPRLQSHPSCWSRRQNFPPLVQGNQSLCVSRLTIAVEVLLKKKHLACVRLAEVQLFLNDDTLSETRCMPRCSRICLCPSLLLKSRESRGPWCAYGSSAKCNGTRHAHTPRAFLRFSAARLVYCYGSSSQCPAPALSRLF